MIFTSSASGSDELLRPSLAATRVQQASAFSGRARDARRAICFAGRAANTTPPPRNRTPSKSNRRSTSTKRAEPLNAKHGREVEDDRAGDGHDEARYDRGDPGGRETTVAGRNGGLR